VVTVEARTPRTVPADDGPDPGGCRAAGCDRPVAYVGTGVCQAHYFRLRRTGTLGLEPIRARRTGCEIPGCGRRHDARGLCATHYSRWLRYGSTELPDRPTSTSRGPDNASWRGDGIGYSGAHRRLRSALGPAAAHPCTRCGTVPAAQWALIHGSPRQRTDATTGLHYSPDPQDYQPLCVSCHKRYDLAELAHTITEWLW
jgi:hypothetical protein